MVVTSVCNATDVMNQHECNLYPVVNCDVNFTKVGGVMSRNVRVGDLILASPHSRSQSEIEPTTFFVSNIISQSISPLRLSNYTLIVVTYMTSVCFFIFNIY